MLNKIAHTFILLCTLGLSSATIYAVDSAAARDALSTSVRSLNLQTKIPEPVEKKREEAVREKPERSKSNRREFDFSPDSLARILMWVAIAVFAAVVVMTILDNLKFGKRFNDPDGEGLAADISPQETQIRMVKAHDEAESYADAGNYAEAMHILLLQSLAEMRRRLDMSIASSLTSREIYARVALSGESREALDDIIGRVEISYFGDHKPERDEYIACRDSYMRLTHLLGGGR